MLEMIGFLRNRIIIVWKLDSQLLNHEVHEPNSYCVLKVWLWVFLMVIINNHCIFKVVASAVKSIAATGMRISIFRYSYSRRTHLDMQDEGINDMSIHNL